MFLYGLCVKSGGLIVVSLWVGVGTSRWVVRMCFSMGCVVKSGGLMMCFSMGCVVKERWVMMCFSSGVGVVKSGGLMMCFSMGCVVEERWLMTVSLWVVL